jgi:decaprenylphospho-beta-D-erythro-pentofuranosid-2-ulose 2-reductase
LINKTRIAIVGATSAMAEHCARLWVKKEPIDLTLIGRDHGRLERVAADVRVRSPNSDVRTIESDFLNPAMIEETIDAIAAQGSLDIVLIAHGSLPNQTECQDSLDLCWNSMCTNGVSPVLFAEGFVKHMATKNKGTIVLIGSVAGDRGRKSNYVYGAAKGLVTRYAQGLQHRFAGTGVKIVLIKPGPTATKMTAHLKGFAEMASVESVAKGIVKAVESGVATVYLPGKWALIMMVVRHLPGHIFNKMNI